MRHGSRSAGGRRIVDQRRSRMRRDSWRRCGRSLQRASCTRCRVRSTSRIGRKWLERDHPVVARFDRNRNDADVFLARRCDRVAASNTKSSAVRSASSMAASAWVVAALRRRPPQPHEMPQSAKSRSFARRRALGWFSWLRMRAPITRCSTAGAEGGQMLAIAVHRDDGIEAEHAEHRAIPGSRAMFRGVAT